MILFLYVVFLFFFFFFSSRRRHTRWNCDWSSDVCSSDLVSSNKSNGQGLTLNNVTGTINMGSTTISNWATTCITVSNTAAAVTSNINFGNTSCTSGGSDGINLLTNASGLRTFGSLTVSGVSATAFIHST